MECESPAEAASCGIGGAVEDLVGEGVAAKGLGEEEA